MSTFTSGIKHKAMRRNDSNENCQAKIDEHPSIMSKPLDIQFDSELIPTQYSMDISLYQVSKFFLDEARLYGQPFEPSPKSAEKKSKKLHDRKNSSSHANQHETPKSHQDRSELTSECLSHNTSDDEWSFLDNLEENKEEQSTESLQEPVVENVKKNEKFKKPVMEPADEELLLELGPKYKNDWKKISKRIFNLRNRRFNS